MSATPLGVVTGSPLGVALAQRLADDGVAVLAGHDRESLARIAAGTRLIVFDADAQSLGELARALGDVVDGGHLLAHTVRGLVAGEHPIQLLRRETAAARVGVIAGPLTAADLIAGRPAAAVIASRHPEVVDEFAAVLSTPRLRVYRGRDPIGVELASGLADLVAIGWGLGEALGFGAATRAVMITRAVRELGRLTAALGGDVNTASGLAGLGDLLVRGGDPASEPFRYGAALAKGPAPASTPALAALADNARSVRALARRHRVSVYLFEGLADLVEGRVTPTDLIPRLMTLPVLDD